jgi:ubiquinone/menaquinone biosynthesis C-methylase UbiE
MDAFTLPDDVTAYYADRFDEAARLSRDGAGRLELLRTRELLRRYLPGAPASVLDVGGGPGAHARWLVEDGYRVHVVDPVPLHVAQAMTACVCTAEVGDARGLSAADASFDVVLMLGPLYHLTSRADRLRALGEARRVVRPGGVVAVAAISRHAALIDKAARGRLDDDATRRLGPVVRTGQHDPSLGFTEAYFHTPAELSGELAEAGFASVAVFGLEGPTWSSLTTLEHAAGVTSGPTYDAVFASALAAARLADGDAEFTSSSSHLLAVAVVERP